MPQPAGNGRGAWVDPEGVRGAGVSEDEAAIGSGFKRRQELPATLEVFQYSYVLCPPVPSSCDGQATSPDHWNPYMPITPPAWTAVIPLRAGSKGLADKNTRLLAGKPLYRHAVDQALSAGAQRVFITTDIASVLSAELPERVICIHRPPELCGDTIPMAPVLLHALQASKCQGPVVLLQATSPLRQKTDIEAALAVFAEGTFELVMSVTQADSGVLKWGTLQGQRFKPLSDPSHCFANRQSLPPVVRPNGAIYAMDADWFRKQGSFVSERIGVHEMPLDRSHDIDNLQDFERCQALLQTQQP